MSTQRVAKAIVCAVLLGAAMGSAGEVPPQTENQPTSYGPQRTVHVSGDALEHGREVWRIGGCAACHATDGSGTPDGPDLTDTRWDDCDGSFEGVRTFIVEGMIEKNPRMKDAFDAHPAGEGINADIDDLTHFVLAMSTSDTIDRSSPRSVVAAVYDLVSYEAGAAPRLRQLGELLHEDAVIVLRTARADFTVLDREGFLDDLRAFTIRDGVAGHAFTERIVEASWREHGDIAHAWVRFEARVHAGERPAHHGIDSIELIREGDVWSIVSITNEISGPSSHPTRR